MIELFMKVVYDYCCACKSGEVYTVTLADVAKEINILNSSKAVQEADLPVKLLKSNKDFFQHVK